MHLRYLALFCVFSVLATAHSVSAQDATFPLYPDVDKESALDETDLKAVFSGQTHVGSYNFLSRNIQTYSFEETTQTDGRTVHTQGTRVDTGDWTIKSDRICYDYDDPALQAACFRIYQRGNCYYHYQVSMMGQSVYGFTARTVIKGETPDCEPSFV